MVYDRTCRGRGPLPGLTHAWKTGALLYSALGRLDAWQGVASWAEALDWLARYASNRPIAEIQFWGHGQWGGLWIEEELLEIDSLDAAHPLNERMRAIRSRLVADGSALWWFRACDTFGTRKGQAFATAWTRFFGCRAAGHTYTINFLQSGLHMLAPGQEPDWSEHEGVVPGLDHASDSRLFAPRTITCLNGHVPRT